MNFMNETAPPKLLQNKNVRYLFLSQIFSALGDGICLLAILTLFGLEREASAMEITYVILSLGLPFVLFGPLTGVLADKYDRKRLMILSDIFRCLIMVVVAFTQEAWILYILLFCKGSFEALFTPAKNGKLKEYVPTEQMDQAVTITTIIDFGSKIIGPALGGVLVASMTTNVAFLVNAATFLISCLFLVGLGKRTITTNQSADDNEGSFLVLFKEGLLYIKNSPSLLYGLLAFSVAMFVLTLTDSQLVILMREIPHMPTSLFGLVMGAVGLGTLLVAGVLSQAKLNSATLLMAAGCLGVGIAFCLITLFTQNAYGGMWVWYPALGLLGGAFAALVFVPFQTMAQKATPEALTSRVFGVIGSLSTLATIVGPLMGGILIEMYGVFPVFFVVSGLLILTSAGLLILFQKEKNKKGIALAEQSG